MSHRPRGKADVRKEQTCGKMPLQTCRHRARGKERRERIGGEKKSRERRGGREERKEERRGEKGGGEMYELVSAKRGKICTVPIHLHFYLAKR